MSRRRLPAWFWWWVATGVAAWLLWMTLRPNPTVAADLAPLTRPAAERGISPHLLIGLAGNVAVFIPLGATLALAVTGGSWKRRLLVAVLAGGGLSLVIELAQTGIPSRVATPSDWLLNTLGAGLGAGAGLWMQKQFDRNRGG